MKYVPIWFVAVSALVVPALGADVEVKEGLAFVTHGGVELKLDIALPSGSEAMRPAVVCIHGGAWRSGNRSTYSDLIKKLASEGYVAATVSYRLSQVAPWPAQLDDVRAAVRWLRQHAETYRIDPERIGVTGGSAGGHLSLMLGLAPDGKVGGDTRVQAIVNYFGPTDMMGEGFGANAVTAIESLVGGERAVKGEVFKDCSPVTHVSRNDPPVLTFHGSLDRTIPVSQAILLHKALEAVKVPQRLDVLEGQGHGWEGAHLDRTIRETVEFFDAYLKGSDAPLLYAEDFSSGVSRWEPTDRSAWQVKSENGRQYYALIKKQSDYTPKVHSPYNISLLKGVSVTDFVLDVSLRSTEKVYGHQDLCLFLGYQDPSHFYYVHVGRNADAHANSIFLVDGAHRVSIATERTEGTDWSGGWHRVRIRRDTKSGRIEVYFDDMTKPVMVTVDKTFLWGRVGVGSFDDTGDFDAIRLRGRLHGVEK